MGTKRFPQLRVTVTVVLEHPQVGHTVPMPATTEVVRALEQRLIQTRLGDHSGGWTVTAIEDWRQGVSVPRDFNPTIVEPR